MSKKRADVQIKIQMHGYRNEKTDPVHDRIAQEKSLVVFVFVLALGESVFKLVNW